MFSFLLTSSRTTKTLFTTCLQSNTKLPDTSLWSQWKWKRFHMTNEPKECSDPWNPNQGPISSADGRWLPVAAETPSSVAVQEAGAGTSCFIPHRVCRAPWGCPELPSPQGPNSSLLLTIHLPRAGNIASWHEAQQSGYIPLTTWLEEGSINSTVTLCL